MSETKFTPGPWEVVETPTRSKFSADWREIGTSGYGRGMVVSASSYHSNVDGCVYGVRISEPNARLIAAAPEEDAALLSLTNEVLAILGIAEDGLRALVGNTNVSCLRLRVEQARAALAKARGEA